MVSSRDFIKVDNVTGHYQPSIDASWQKMGSKGTKFNCQVFQMFFFDRERSF